MKQVAPFVNKNLPAFVREEDPAMVAFVEAYYEWMDQRGGFSEQLANLTDYRSIDSTVNDFIEYFRSEFLVTIPKTALVDKALLTKHIKEFYRAKGTEKSYKFLFQILFQENVDFIYPKNSVLRTSDGKWQEEKSIKVGISVPYVTNQDSLVSKQIIGQTSGATAVVEKTIQSVQSTTKYLELTVSEIVGNFVVGETVEVQDSLGTVLFSGPLLPLVVGVTITNGGSGYAKNSVFYVKDGGTTVGNGRVLSVSTSRIESVSLVSGGVGYKGRHQNIHYRQNVRLDETAVGVPAIADTISAYSTESITSYSVPGFVQRDTGSPETFVVTDALGSSGAGAGGELTTTNDIGTIETVTLTNKGNSLYFKPEYTINTVAGSGAVLSLVGGGGKIVRARMDNFPIWSSNVAVDMASIGDGNAVLQVVTGAVGTYAGRWITTDSLLSSDQKIQDSKYYQDFSYVLSSRVDMVRWEQIIKETVHPAGLALFGIRKVTEQITGDLSIKFAEKFSVHKIKSGLFSSVLTYAKSSGLVRSLALYVSQLGLTKETHKNISASTYTDIASVSKSTLLERQQNATIPFTGTFAALELQYLANSAVSLYQTVTPATSGTGYNLNVYHSELRVDFKKAYVTVI